MDEYCPKFQLAAYFYQWVLIENILTIIHYLSIILYFNYLILNNRDYILGPVIRFLSIFIQENKKIFK